MTGDDIVETVTFALDGQTYDVDLTSKDADAFRKVLSPFVRAGRRVPTERGTAPECCHCCPTAKTVRTWARANGYDVADRGRLRTEIREAYVRRRAAR
ncbi:Lsr2 family protein [Kribbella sp. NPDC000426]|uniref:histone-like nucleoid-structuring protein Lsr2 n=1 Tax=Kribbella sp. NPDC000426 TaxID=3154255 RepID=UPI00331C5268